MRSCNQPTAYAHSYMQSSIHMLTTSQTLDLRGSHSVDKAFCTYYHIGYMDGSLWSNEMMDQQKETELPVLA